MNERFFNFCAGPATIPLPVMEQVKEEFLSYQGMGASIIEVSHRSESFKQLFAEAKSLIREVMSVPADYQILFMHGGGQMHFSTVPLNLIGRLPEKKAQYVVSGLFSELAVKEAHIFGKVEVVASSKETNYNCLPTVNWEQVETSPASYLHITSNNTAMGTQWKEFPKLKTPLVADMTSDICSRPLDISQFGMIYAGAQKNLGAAGLSIVIVKQDLLNHALPETPLLLNYKQASERVFVNTPNTFAIYVLNLIMKWIKKMGGLAEMEKLSISKSNLIYDALDQHKEFYRTHAVPADRSLMNITFFLPDQAMVDTFVAEANQRKLYFLTGHPAARGMRASVYIGMSLEGAKALAEFLKDFAQRYT